MCVLFVVTKFVALLYDITKIFSQVSVVDLYNDEALQKRKKLIFGHKLSHLFAISEYEM